MAKLVMLALLGFQLCKKHPAFFTDYPKKKARTLIYIFHPAGRKGVHVRTVRVIPMSIGEVESV